LQHSQAARGIGERKLRFTRDSECGIQARNVAYLYLYELGYVSESRTKPRILLTYL
jgi:hypothetical protein